MKNFRLITTAIFSMFFLFACDNDDDHPTMPPIWQDNTITAIAANNDDLSLLVEALQITDLADVFNQAGNYTVFAPNNAAFQDLLDSNNGWDSLNDIPENVLANVLKYHVLTSVIRSSDLSDTYVPTLADFMASGEDSEFISLPVITTGGVYFDGDTQPITVDIEASNGIIHVVDKVMLPNNVVQFALDNPAFTSLVVALTDPRLQADYVSILSGDGPFTVFAPTNDAFDALLDSNNNWNSLSDVPANVLEAVLQYHVVAGANVQADELNDGQNIATFLGQDITIDLSSGAKIETASGQSVDIIITDVQGTNGVVHAVNQVLIPAL